MDVDAIGLTRRRGARRYDHINDRRYAASSFLSVALGTVFGSALRGKAGSHADLAASTLPLVAHLAAVPSSGGADLVGRLFAPLVWDIDVVPHAVDAAFPAWGMGTPTPVRPRRWRCSRGATCEAEDP